MYVKLFHVMPIFIHLLMITFLPYSIYLSYLLIKHLIIASLLQLPQLVARAHQIKRLNWLKASVQSNCPFWFAVGCGCCRNKARKFFHTWSLHVLLIISDFCWYNFYLHSLKDNIFCCTDLSKYFLEYTCW